MYIFCRNYIFIFCVVLRPYNFNRMYYAKRRWLTGGLAPTFLIASSPLAYCESGARKFQCSGEIDAVEGIVLAIRKVGEPPVCQLCSKIRKDTIEIEKGTFRNRENH